MMDAVTNHDPREFAEWEAFPVDLQFLYLGWGMLACRQQIANSLWQGYMEGLT